MERRSFKINYHYIAFSPISTFQVRLPEGNNLNLLIDIRDLLDSITEYNLSSINVLSHLTINSLQELSENNSLIQLLSNGNRDTIGQIISSLSNEFNKINNKIIENVISSNDY